MKEPDFIKDLFGPEADTVKTYDAVPVETQIVSEFSPELLELVLAAECL